MYDYVNMNTLLNLLIAFIINYVQMNSEYHIAKNNFIYKSNYGQGTS